MNWVATAIGAVFVYVVVVGFVFVMLDLANKHGADDADRMMTLYATERDFDAVGSYPNSDLPAAQPNGATDE